MSDSEPDSDDYASAEEMDTEVTSGEKNGVEDPDKGKVDESKNAPSTNSATGDAGGVTHDKESSTTSDPFDKPSVSPEQEDDPAPKGEEVEAKGEAAPTADESQSAPADLLQDENDDSGRSSADGTTSSSTGAPEPEPVVQEEPVAAGPTSRREPERASASGGGGGGGGGGWNSWSSWGMSLAATVIPQVPEDSEPAAEPASSVADNASAAAADVASAAAATAASAAAGFFSMLGGSAQPQTEGKETDAAAVAASTQEPSASPTAAAAAGSSGGGGGGLFDMFGGISGISATLQEKGGALVAGSLDTLELIGKKTVQVLTEDDPGFRSTRERIRSGRSKNPNLSEMLREAKTQTDVVKTQAEDSSGSGGRAALVPREKGYNDFFEEYHGMIHLEALELLSRQSGSMSTGMIAGAEPFVAHTARRYADKFETTRKESDNLDNADEATLFDKDRFLEAVQEAVNAFGVPLSLSSLAKTAQECERRCKELEESTMESAKIQEAAICTLAQVTALSIEVFHKAAELMLLPATDDEEDAEAFANAKCEACFGFSDEICRQGEYLVNSFVKALNLSDAANKDKIAATVTSLFIEASNSVGYTRDGCDFMLSTVQVVYLTRASA